MDRAHRELGLKRALEQSGSARRLSRLLLVVGAVVYTLWHYLHVYVMPGARDPIWERVAIASLVVVFVLVSFVRGLHTHLVFMGHSAVVLATLHYFSLVARNQIAPSYLVGAFVVLASFNLLLLSFAAVTVYSALALALATAVSLFTAGASPENRLLLVGGVFTAQIALASTAWRNVALAGSVREAARLRRELANLRGLLPMCMHCSRIRLHDGGWQKLEQYVEERSEASFTHSLCDECLRKHHPE
jgi:hypothetical protein